MTLAYIDYHLMTSRKLTAGPPNLLSKVAMGCINWKISSDWSHLDLLRLNFLTALCFLHWCLWFWFAEDSACASIAKRVLSIRKRQQWQWMLPPSHIKLNDPAFVFSRIGDLLSRAHRYPALPSSCYCCCNNSCSSHRLCCMRPH